jgi:alpha/beta superfamily hydrolase
VCHGLGWHKDNELIIAICKSFQEKGLNSFRFNFSGTEPSEGKTEDSYYTKQASDLCSVIDYFSIQGYRIKSILGHSIGATATIIQAAKDRRIASIILIAPRMKPSNSIIVKAIIESGKTLPDAIESTETSYSIEIKGKKGKGRRTYRFSKKYLEELRDIDIVGYLNQIKIPILILRGTEDDIVPEEEVEEACKANMEVEHIAINGAGHTFKKSEEKDKLISEILQWYESIMKRPKIVKLIFIFYAIFGLAFVYGILALLGISLPLLPFLQKPLQIDLGISWAILALISMLTLTYVQLINSLSEYLRKHKDSQEASWRKVSLSLTTGMHFITVFFLTLRIIYLSFDPEAYQYSCSKALIFGDWIILNSFLLGSFMRICIFFDSYGEDFTKYIQKHL